MGVQNLRSLVLLRLRIHRCAIYRVATRRISTIRPIHHTALEIQLQVNRLGQAVEEDFDVCTIRGALALGYFDIRAKDAALSSIIRAFLRPVDLPALDIKRDPHTPFRSIAARTRITLTRIHEGFDL